MNLANEIELAINQGLNQFTSESTGLLVISIPTPQKSGTEHQQSTYARSTAQVCAELKPRTFIDMDNEEGFYIDCTDRFKN